MYEPSLCCQGAHVWRGVLGRITSQVSGYWLFWGIFLSGHVHPIPVPSHLQQSMLCPCPHVQGAEDIQAPVCSLRAHEHPPARALRSSVPLA